MYGIIYTRPQSLFFLMDNLILEILYRACGKVRFFSDTTPTNYTYTGQYSNTSTFGLMYYNARWYDPALGRFAQADTMIPGAGNPQAYDRYTYVFNNPVNGRDPSGHIPCANTIIRDDQVICMGGSGGGGNSSTDVQSSTTNEDTENGTFHPLGLDGDYYSLQIYHGFPGWMLGLFIAAIGLVEPTPIEELSAIELAALINAGITLTIDRYGRLYISPGIQIGINSIELLPTFSITEGNLMKGRSMGIPNLSGGSATEIEKLLTGFSINSSASYPFFPTVGITTSQAAPYNAIDFGAGFPGNLNFITFSFGFGPFQVIPNP